jgi:hypothetical protein
VCSVSGALALVSPLLWTQTGQVPQHAAPTDGTLDDLQLRSGAPPVTLARVADGLRAAFPGLAVTIERTGGGRPTPAIAGRSAHVVVVPVSWWRAPELDLLGLDRAVAQALAEMGRCSLCVVDDTMPEGDLLETALQVVTRYQRHLDGRNLHSATPLFQAILARHRSLYDLSKPPVAAGYDHARDTWRWVLRLQPEASAAVQVAALFHDVERLARDREVRVEPGRNAGRDAPAAAGARLAAEAITEAGAGPDLVERVAALVATHERPGEDPEKALLNEAAALSFFSLNAPGFAHDFGSEHTARKVAYTLARLGPRGMRALAGVRHRADIAALIRRSAEV